VFVDEPFGWQRFATTLVELEKSVCPINSHMIEKDLDALDLTQARESPSKWTKACP